MSDKKEKIAIDREDVISEETQTVSKNSKPKKIKKNKQKFKDKSLNDSKFKYEQFLKSLDKLTNGLIYISETDAEISPFKGTFAENVSQENLLSQIRSDSETRVEEYKFEDFFRHPSIIQDWMDDERREVSKQYLSLKNLLLDNLRDLKVFKIGTINLEIYIIGLDAESNLTGIKTKAVET